MSVGIIFDKLLSDGKCTIIAPAAPKELITLRSILWTYRKRYNKKFSSLGLPAPLEDQTIKFIPLMDAKGNNLIEIKLISKDECIKGSLNFTIIESEEQE